VGGGNRLSPYPSLRHFLSGQQGTAKKGGKRGDSRGFTSLSHHRPRRGERGGKGEGLEPFLFTVSIIPVEEGKGRT